jgi:hypothetical protein
LGAEVDRGSEVEAGAALSEGGAAVAVGTVVSPRDALLAEAPPLLKASSTVASSIEDEAVLISTPAALSRVISSLLERPCSLAISCTRFLLMS